MKKIFRNIFIFLIVLTGNASAQNATFPFLKPGNEWIYEGDNGSGKFDISYKILSQNKNGYYQIQTKFFNNSIVSANTYWYADAKSFSFFTAWPQSSLKLTILSPNCKPGDSWEVFIPQSLDKDDDELSGFRVTKVISIDETVMVPGGTFENCIRIKETFSSEPRYFMDYFFHKHRGLIKMEGTGYMTVNEEGRKFFPIKYELKGKDTPEEKPMITLAGCVNMVVGESSLLPVSFKPAGGTIRYWTEGKGITVSDGGNGANVKATEPGKAIVWAEYTTPKGVKIKKSKTVYSLKVNSINSGNPLQLGLYDVKGNPTNGLKAVPVSIEPAGEVTQLSFKPADAAIISAAPSGNNQLKVQGIKTGKTTVQAYSDCGTQTGPFLNVEVVNCDDEVVKELKKQEKELKEKLDANVKEVSDLLNSKEFKDIEDKGVKAIEDVRDGLIDLAIAFTAAGPAKTVLSQLSDYRTLYDNYQSGQVLMTSLQVMIMSMKDGIYKDLAGVMKTTIETSKAATDLSKYVTDLDNIEARLNILKLEYEKIQFNYLAVTRVLYKVCRRDGEPPAPEEEPKRPTTKPNKPKPKKPLTASGEPDSKADEKTDESKEPPVNPPNEPPNPPETEPGKKQTESIL